MSDYSTVQERNEFENNIFDQVQDYLSNKDAYVDNIGLIINTQSLEINLGIKEECSENEEWHDLDDLINDNEPDCDAIYDLASSYCFIR